MSAREAILSNIRQFGISAGPPRAANTNVSTRRPFFRERNERGQFISFKAAYARRHAAELHPQSGAGAATSDNSREIKDLDASLGSGFDSVGVGLQDQTRTLSANIQKLTKTVEEKSSGGLFGRVGGGLGKRGFGKAAALLAVDAAIDPSGGILGSIADLDPTGTARYALDGTKRILSQLGSAASQALNTVLNNRSIDLQIPDGRLPELTESKETEFDRALEEFKKSSGKEDVSRLTEYFRSRDGSPASNALAAEPALGAASGLSAAPPAGFESPPKLPGMTHSGQTGADGVYRSPPSSPSSPSSGSGKKASGGYAAGDALAVAEKYVDANEYTDTQRLAALLGADPRGKSNAWCARFVNAALRESGGQGTGSGLANSFQGWGTGVAHAGVKRNDVILDTRGRGPNESGGHVGIATGETRVVNGRLQMRMLAGNQGDAVSYAWVDASENIMVRRGLPPPPAGAGQSAATADGGKPPVDRSQDLPAPSTENMPGKVTAVDGSEPKAVIIHHTGGRGTVEGVKGTLDQRGLGVQYVMDREGNIVQIGGPGASHMKPGWGPAGTGLSNANVVGMEVIGRDDKDITPQQVAAAKAFIARNYPNTPVYGHGEVNPGHKEATEGMAIVGAIRAERQKAGSVVPQVAVPTPTTPEEKKNAATEAYDRTRTDNPFLKAGPVVKPAEAPPPADVNPTAPPEQKTPEPAGADTGYPPPDLGGGRDLTEPPSSSARSDIGFSEEPWSGEPN